MNTQNSQNPMFEIVRTESGMLGIAVADDCQNQQAASTIINSVARYLMGVTIMQAIALCTLAKTQLMEAIAKWNASIEKKQQPEMDDAQMASLFLCCMNWPMTLCASGVAAAQEKKDYVAAVPSLEQLERMINSTLVEGCKAIKEPGPITGEFIRCLEPHLGILSQASVSDMRSTQFLTSTVSSMLPKTDSTRAPAVAAS